MPNGRSNPEMIGTVRRSKATPRKRATDVFNPVKKTDEEPSTTTLAKTDESAKQKELAIEATALPANASSSSPYKLEQTTSESAVPVHSKIPNFRSLVSGLATGNEDPTAIPGTSARGGVRFGGGTGKRAQNVRVKVPGYGTQSQDAKEQNEAQKPSELTQHAIAKDAAEARQKHHRIICRNQDRTVNEYKHCDCVLCQNRNRSVWLRVKTKLVGLPHEIQSRIKTALEGRFSNVDDIIPSPGKGGYRAFVVR